MESVSAGGGRVFLSGEAGGGDRLKKCYLTQDQKKTIHDILSDVGDQVKLEDINGLIASKCSEESLFQLNRNQLNKIKEQWRKNSFFPEERESMVPIGDLLWSVTQKEIAYQAVMECCKFNKETGEREKSRKGIRKNEQIQLKITELCKQKKEPPFTLEAQSMNNLTSRHFRTWCSLEDFVAKPISIGLAGSAQKRCRENALWSLDQKTIFHAAAIKYCQFDEMGRRKLGVTSSAEIQKEIDEECKRRGIPSFQPVRMAKFLKDHFNSKEVAEKFIGKEIFLRCCDPVDPSGSLREEGEDIKRRKGPAAAEAGGADLARPDSSIEVGSSLVVKEGHDELLFLDGDEEDTLDAYIQGLLDRGISGPFVRAEESLEEWFPGEGVVDEGDMSKA